MRAFNYPSLLLLAFAAYPAFFGSKEDIPTEILIIAGASFAYFVYYIFHTKLYEEILGGIIISVVVMLLGLIPIIGIIIVVCYVLFNVLTTLAGLKALIPDVIASVILYALLTVRLHLDPAGDYLACWIALYAIVSLAYARSLRGYAGIDAFFKMSIMWLAVPLAIMTILSIISALGNMFKQLNSTITRSIRVPQNVSGYVRNGVAVDSYTRNISKPVTEHIMQIKPSTGIVTSSLSSQATELQPKKHKEN
jgi:hypothetical protein